MNLFGFVADPKHAETPDSLVGSDPGDKTQGLEDFLGPAFADLNRPAATPAVPHKFASPADPDACDVAPIGRSGDRNASATVWPTLSTSELLFHPSVAWLAEIVVVGFACVAVGAATAWWNPPTSDISPARLMIPLIECWILIVLAWRRLSVLRMLRGFALVCLVVVMYLSSKWITGSISTLASTNLQVTTQILAVFGAVVSTVALREAVRRIHVLTSGIPVRPEIAAQADTIFRNKYPDVITRIKWQFRVDGAEFRGLCRIPYSESLSARLESNDVLIVYLPANPKKNILHIEPLRLEATKKLGHGIIRHPVFLVFAAAVAIALIRIAVAWPHYQQRTQRNGEIAAVLMIDDDCQFMDRWKKLGEDELTAQYSDTVARRDSQCGSKKREETLAIEIDCVFKWSWEKLGDYAETAHHLANARIQACDDEMRRIREANPVGDTVTAVNSPARRTIDRNRPLATGNKDVCMLMCHGNAQRRVSQGDRRAAVPCYQQCGVESPLRRESNGNEALRLFER